MSSFIIVDLWNATVRGKMVCWKTTITTFSYNRFRERIQKEKGKVSLLIWLIKVRNEKRENLRWAFVLIFLWSWGLNEEFPSRRRQGKKASEHDCKKKTLNRFSSFLFLLIESIRILSCVGFRETTPNVTTLHSTVVSMLSGLTAYPSSTILSTCVSRTLNKVSHSPNPKSPRSRARFSTNTTGRPFYAPDPQRWPFSL